jgi:hypothetical protein
MPENIQDTLTRLLRYQRAPAKATQALRSWKHNADILPRLQLQLEMLLNAHGKFEPVVYDTQGIHDHGTDIVLRYRLEALAGDFELIGFQVKSFDDLCKKTYMQELKAQRDDAFRKVLGLRYYYLVVCTDSDAHKDRVRNIMAEFRSADRTEVVEPEFVFTFLHHPQTRVEALVKRVMEAEDLVFRSALDSLDLPNPSARALILFLVVRYATSGAREFASRDLLAEPALRSIYSELREQQASLLGSVYTSAGSDSRTPVGDSPEAENVEVGADEIDWWEDDDEEDPPQIAEYEMQLAADLSLLESYSIDLDTDSGATILRPEQLRPLNAVVTDALARYDYDQEQLLAYMYNLFGVRD